MSEQAYAEAGCKSISMDISMNVKTNANNDVTMRRFVMRLAVKEDVWYKQRTSRET